MLNINGKNLDIFGITEVLQFTVDTTNYIDEGSNWAPNTLEPLSGNKYEGFRELNTQFLFEGYSKEETLKNISRFIEECKQSIFKKDNLYYKVDIKGKSKPELLNPVSYLLSLSFNLLNIYEEEKSILITENSTLIINSPKECYANLEILAPINSISYTVKVNDIEITVRNIKANEKVHIGEGKVTAGGISKMNDVDMWEFPRLKPGINSIEVNSSDVNLTIKYKERW